MYALIKAGKATMQELKTCYTLDEALKLYALFRMDSDIEAAHAKEMSDKGSKGR
jgi:acyl-CoA-binding protein